MPAANERWRYIVTSSLIGWAHTQNDACNVHKSQPYSILISEPLGIKCKLEKLERLRSEDTPCHLMICLTNAGTILCMPAANERWCYIVTSSLIGWAHTQNDACNVHKSQPYSILISEPHGIKCKLEQLERLRSEDTPHRLMITHTIESYWIPS